MKETPYTRTLQLALEDAGSLESLAHLLQVPPTLLQVWLEGAEPLPPEMYLQALDLVARGPFWTGSADKRTYH